LQQIECIPINYLSFARNLSGEGGSRLRATYGVDDIVVGCAETYTLIQCVLVPSVAKRGDDQAPDGNIDESSH
jgi:hypothetical protein